METIRYAYDVEVFRNLFTAIFINVNDKNDIHTFTIGLGKDDRIELKRFISRNIVLIGYNSHSYDDPMLRFITDTTEPAETLVNKIYALSQKLVDENFRSNKSVLKLRYPKKGKFRWYSIDLMKILAFDRMGVSLKQTAINLRWHKIQDLPLHFTARVKFEEVDTIIKYNINDVLITIRLYEEIKPLRDLRDELSKLYHVDLSSASNSKMANILLEHFYTEKTGTTIDQIKDLRTSRDKVLLGNCIAPFVKFKTPQLQELLDRISSTYVYEFNNYKYGEKLQYYNCIYSLGVGGLHTEDDATTFETDEDYIIQDMDVASYYPNLIINNNFYPQHLGEEFISVLKMITDERIKAKKSGDKVKADGLKITINSIFGKLGSKFFWLLDPKQMLSTTLSGQMGLLMLVEELELAGIPVISCNTDGVVCKIPREKEERYYEIAHQWERDTGLDLEYTFYQKYIRFNVNAYITQKDDGATKEKGLFIRTVKLGKAFRNPIVSEALYQYFINGIDVKYTIENCKDILQFCISQKTGKAFEIELHTKDGIENLQKTNRFFVSKDGGALRKRDRTTGRETGLMVGRIVTILNDYDESLPFSTYSVDYPYYVAEAMKIIDCVEPKQMSLFDTTGFSGTVKKVEVAPREAQELEMNSFQLNKLGKNQRAGVISSIVENNKKIPDISSKYVYVKSFDGKTRRAILYCLRKGIEHELFISNKAYKDNGLVENIVIHCDSFSRIDGLYTVHEYSIVDKFEKEVESLF